MCIHRGLLVEDVGVIRIQQCVLFGAGATHLDSRGSQVLCEGRARIVAPALGHVPVVSRGSELLGV